MPKDNETKEHPTDQPSPVAEPATEKVISVDNAQDVKKVILDSYREKTGVCPKCGAPLILSNQARTVMANHKMTSVTEASIQCPCCNWRQAAKNREDHVVPALAPETNMETRPMPRDPFEGTILDPNVIRRLRAEALARSVFGQSTLLGLPRLVPDPFGLDFSFPF